MSAYFALLLVHLHFPEASDLKAKRKELQSIKSLLHGRLGAAVAEVDHHDLWQRATLAAALTSGSTAQLDQAADRVERWLEERCPAGVSVERRVASFQDLNT